MEKEKRTRGITDVLLILVITILAGTVLILSLIHITLPTIA